MTVVRHKFLRPSPAGDVPYSLELRFRPSRARVLDGDPKAVVVPAEFTEDLPAGILNVDLAPTGPGWCWEIFRPYGKVESLREWVVVPEPVADPDNPGEFLPVDYPDLVRVDPATLEPTAEPSPLWWAALEAAKATAADVEAARVAAAGSAVEAGAARDDAVVAAGEASGFAGDAAGSASVAVAAAGSAGTDADTATAQAGAAGLALTGAESARDATVAAAGGSEASAALASVAATDSAQSAASAEAVALDVVTRANNGEFKGDQGLPGNATMRVDTTVGTRIFITDGITEHMLKGDTGWRAIQWWDADGVVGGLSLPGPNSSGYVPATGRAGGVYYRRINDTVHVRVLAITTTVVAPSFPIPNGFNAGGSPWPSGLIRGNDATPYQYRAGGSAIFSGLASGLTTEAQYAIEFSWVTKSPWPPTNPGIPG